MGESMVGAQSRKLPKDALRRLAIVLVETQLKTMVEVILFLVGQQNPAQCLRPRLGNQRHPARPGESVVIETFLDAELALTANVRITDQKRLAKRVIPNDGLKMGAGRLDGSSRVTLSPKK